MNLVLFEGFSGPVIIIMKISYRQNNLYDINAKLTLSEANSCYLTGIT